MKEKIENLLYNLNDKLEGGFIKMPKNDIAAYVSKIVTKGKIITIINKDKLEAFIAFYDNDVNKEIAYLSMLAVDFDSLGKSYGKTLMETAIRTLQKQGFTYFDIDVDPENTIAMDFAKFYEFKILEKGKMFKVRKKL